MNKSRSQSGSIVAYAIAAVVLLALLAGAFYWAKHRAQNSTEQPANAPAQEAGKSSSSKQSNKSDSSKTEHQTTSDNQAKPNTSSEQSNANNPSDHDGGASQPAAGSDSTEASGHIAPAGPTDVIQTVAGLSVLAGAGAAYRQSRRRLTKA
ncbi:MAG TPA: hypothetical protein VFK03_03805 [Candidatus Saccharimonadales bacterium]|nr:hypothetical protein [Candidatus Saccharimonadales bacterium]